MITTSGFTVADYGVWPLNPIIFKFLMLMGGCSDGKTRSQVIKDTTLKKNTEKSKFLVVFWVKGKKNKGGEYNKNSEKK